MSEQRGTAFLLKVSENSETYATVAGLKVKTLKINSESVPAVTKDNGWRELFAGAGIRSVSILSSGIFCGSTAEALIKSTALAGTIEPYELSFETGERLRGRFLISQLDYTGDYNGERNYQIALESSGEVVQL